MLTNPTFYNIIIYIISILYIVCFYYLRHSILIVKNKGMEHFGINWNLVGIHLGIIRIKKKALHI